MGTVTPKPPPRRQGPKMKRRGPSRWRSRPVDVRPRHQETIQGYTVYITDATKATGLPKFEYEVVVPWSDLSYHAFDYYYDSFDSFVKARSAARKKVAEFKKIAGKRAGKQKYKAKWDETFDIRWDGKKWYVVHDNYGHDIDWSFDEYRPTVKPYRPAVESHERWQWQWDQRERFDTSEEAYDAMGEAIDKSYAAQQAKEGEERKAEKKLAGERKKMEGYMGRASNPGPVSAADLTRRLKF